jgi:hypothetical protein
MPTSTYVCFRATYQCVLCDNTLTAIIRFRFRWKQATCSCQARLCSSGCAASDTSRPVASRVSAAFLAVFALNPDPAVGAHAFAAAVAAVAPDAVMLADAGAPAVLALAPLAVMLADAGAPAVLVDAPDAVMVADICEHRRATAYDGEYYTPHSVWQCGP